MAFLMNQHEDDKAKSQNTGMNVLADSAIPNTQSNNIQQLGSSRQTSNAQNVPQNTQNAQNIPQNAPKQSSGMFNNITEYLKQNAPQSAKMAEAVGSTVQKSGQQVQSESQNVLDQSQQGIAKQQDLLKQSINVTDTTAKGLGATNNTNTVQATNVPLQTQNPSQQHNQLLTSAKQVQSQTQQGQDINQKLADYVKGVNEGKIRYEFDPSSINKDKLISEMERFSGKVEGSKTESGLRDLLTETFSDPEKRYTAGSARLDSLLIQSGEGAKVFGNLVEQARESVGNKLTADQNQIINETQRLTEANNQRISSLNSQLNQIQSALSSEKQQLTEQQKQQAMKAAQDLTAEKQRLTNELYSAYDQMQKAFGIGQYRTDNFDDAITKFENAKAAQAQQQQTMQNNKYANYDPQVLQAFLAGARDRESALRLGFDISKEDIQNLANLVHLDTQPSHPSVPRKYFQDIEKELRGVLNYKQNPDGEDISALEREAAELAQLRRDSLLKLAPFLDTSEQGTILAQEGNPYWHMRAGVHNLLNPYSEDQDAVVRLASQNVLKDPNDIKMVKDTLEQILLRGGQEGLTQRINKQFNSDIINKALAGNINITPSYSDPYVGRFNALQNILGSNERVSSANQMSEDQQNLYNDIDRLRSQMFDVREGEAGRQSMLSGNSADALKRGRDYNNYFNNLMQQIQGPDIVRRFEV
jgi:hypothetical protein